MRTTCGRFVTLLGAAAFGLLAAHELDYRLVVPDPEHRHDLLLRTGHGYLSRALFIALVVGVLALVASVALGVARGRGRDLDQPSVRGQGLMLATVQAGGFVILEAVERLIVAPPPDDRMLAVTFTGVAVQVLAAFGAAFVLSLLERAASIVARALVRTVPSVRISRVTDRLVRSVALLRRAVEPYAGRAPPLAARS